MKLHAVLGSALLAFIVGACGNGASPASSAPAPSLVGHTFVGTSVTVNGVPRPLVKGTSIVLTFSKGRIGSSAGCNQMGGNATWNGGTLRVNGLATTEMACAEPRMRQDGWWSHFLSSQPTWKHSQAALTLTSNGTIIRLTDQEVAVPSATLTGTTWHLTTTTDGNAASSVPHGVTSTLQFGHDGRVHVRPGCNTGNGPYTVEGDLITFGPIGVTMMACPDPQMQVEHTVLRALEGALPFSIDGDQLTLQSTREDSGQTVTLVYQAVADSEAS